MPDYRFTLQTVSTIRAQNITPVTSALTRILKPAPFRVLILLVVATTSTPLFLSASEPSPPPNILWITAEDMSATLGCYGDDYAITPNLDRLADESLQYSHAFATAPVCSPVRSCLITGCYAPSLGTHQMRSAFAIPDSIRGFPAYLREAGYYTTNNEKTDYNTSSAERLIKESWDESSLTAHWRNRPGNRPFFSVFNLMTTHQSRTMVWTHDRFVAEIQSGLSPDQIHDPGEAPVPPYYPDTPIIRKTIARYYDCVAAMDRQVGDILSQLEADGLADDTLVFFFSDHGSGLPRHKRALLDTGMHVPLLIRFPEKYRHLSPHGSGEVVDRLVSFVDFPPTLLNLAGIDRPSYMQGKPFLGASVGQSRTYAFGHRDRVDEVFDLARSVRDRRFLYIRNYMPHLGYNQPTAWPDLSEVRHEFYRLADPIKMTGPQWHFAGPTRPIEELYDCESDPLNLNNLADSDQAGDVLDRLRNALDDHLRETNDLGFIPESYAWQLFGNEPPWNVAQSVHFKESEIGRQAARTMLEGQSDESLVARLIDRDAVRRYWAAIGLGAHESESEMVAERLENQLDDESAAVRVEVAAALSRHGRLEHALPALIEEVEDDDLTVVLHAARTIELINGPARDAIPAMRAVMERAERLNPSDTPATFVLSKDQDLAMFASFAAGGFLQTVEPTSEPQQVETPWSARPEIVDQFASRRGEFNYDESKVPEYTVPDPLVDSQGQSVANAKQWNGSRRAELLDLFRDQVYGRRPTTDYTLRFEQDAEIDDAFDGAATGRSMTATVTIGERKFSFPFVIFVPNNVEGPMPAVVHINNRYFVPLDKAATEHDPFWPVKTLIERGYATASFHTSDVDPDNKNGYDEGIRAFFADGEPPEDNAWRSLSAWGWAASRVLDHLESLDTVDSSRVAVVGHSRGGKTSLWAACEDPRFAIAYSNDSGCGGAALSRRSYGETVGRITTNFPHWFCKPFAQYAEREGELPIDQHEVISLIAPRGVYVASADEDLWADPKGEYTSLILAAPVFQLLGKESITATEMPPLNQPRVVGQTGYHIRDGGHGLGDKDWNWFLDFADRLVK